MTQPTIENSTNDAEDSDDEFVCIEIDDLFLEYEPDIRAVETIASDSGSEVDESSKIRLPHHVKCSCHLLSLIETSDINKISDPIFKRLKKKVDVKLQRIWNKQARSSQSLDFIRDKLGVLFILFNATRWNSFFDALNCVHTLNKTKNEELADFFRHFNLTVLTKNDQEYIAEYIRIMEPLTQALDDFQTEAWKGEIRSTDYGRRWSRARP